MSGVFWTSEEDWGAGGELGGETEAGERVVRVYKARCTNYSLFSQEPLSSFALLHWSWHMGLADWPCMQDACARRPLHAPGLLLGLFNRVVME